MLLSPKTRMQLLTLLVFFLSAPVVVQSTPGYWNGRGFSSRLVSVPNKDRGGTCGYPSKRWAFRQTVKEEASTTLCEIDEEATDRDVARIIVRGGDNLDSNRNNLLDDSVNVALKVITTGCRTILPPAVALVRAVIAFYTVLPVDAILAQAGLVYCFAGGYFPTLFAAVQAAQHCGWEVMVGAIDDLAEEAVAAIRACDFQPSGGYFFSSGEAKLKAHEIFTQKTKVILATIDPTKINQAVAALYTTWMGVSTVLEREFAKTIALSVTIADYLKPTVNFILAPPVYHCVPREYHRWVPVILGWACKAAAMSLAWRIQRVLTAYTSAIAGGLMFSRSCFRMLRKRGVRLFGLIPKDSDRSYLDEIVGFTVAGFGLYSQIGDGFDFDIPFPINLVTWPFELAERWIQWQITKKRD